jgi:membrane protein YqaA with SNARE-associated domain
MLTLFESRGEWLLATAATLASVPGAIVGREESWRGEQEFPKMIEMPRRSQRSHWTHDVDRIGWVGVTVSVVAGVVGERGLGGKKT